MSGIGWFASDLTKLVGEILPGRVYIVIAPTGTGKTTFATNCVYDFLQYDQFHSLIFPTEESYRFPQLLACRHLGVSYRSFVNGLLDEQKHKIRLQSAVFLADPFVDVYRSLNLSLPEIMHELAATIERRGVAPHVLLLDHIHRLDRQNKPLPQHLEMVIRKLQELASQWQMAVIVFAQIHRPPGRDLLHKYKIPPLEAIKACAEIEQCGDVCLGLSKKLKPDIPAKIKTELATGMRDIGEFVMPNVMRVTCLKHRIDPDPVDHSRLLTVRDGAITNYIDPEKQGDAYEGDLPF